MIKLNFKKVNEEAIIPKIVNPMDAGIDLHSVEDMVVFPGSTTVISTGLSMEIEWDLSAEIEESNYIFPDYAKEYYKSLNTDSSFWFNQWLMTNMVPYFKIESRSGLSTKGIHVGAGVIDVDYRGEIKIVIHNISKKAYEFHKGDKIAQGILQFKPRNITIEEVMVLSDSVRGENGFGSSGR